MSVSISNETVDAAARRLTDNCGIQRSDVKMVADAYWAFSEVARQEAFEKTAMPDETFLRSLGLRQSRVHEGWLLEGTVSAGDIVLTLGRDDPTCNVLIVGHVIVAKNLTQWRVRCLVNAMKEN